MQDHYGNKVSTASNDAVTGYDRGVYLFLSGTHGAAEAFGQAIAADDGFALAHAGQARALMMGGDMAGSKAAIARADALAPGVTPREQAHIAAFVHLLSGRPADAMATVRAHVQEHPRDAMVAQLCTSVFGLIGFSGKTGREAELLAYTAGLLPHYGEDWWMMSQHAVSLCETGQLDASATLMERSLALNPRNAHGAHFKAHEQYEAGETTAGRAYLGDWITDYDRRSILHGHLSWHLALWALHDGDTDAMWAAVDHGVAPGTGHSLPINVLTDTAAIYYRAEIAGHEVAPDRWAGLSDYAANVFPQTGQSFADLHAALAHAMAGQGERLAQIAEGASGFAGDLVRPVARAWGAIARHDWAGALDGLLPAMAATERLGGSRAQRDLIELAYVNVLMRLGHSDEARHTLKLRRPVLTTKPPVSGLQMA
ncbi:MAG: tetratricopeptide repeat protein [Rhodobacteraceae bacterium]|nr:tetratricopeptide repeat protein [Paracoccaceae bacterium]